MRTKTLLIAAAALALSLATSQAQVYSANVVGYANVVLPGNGAQSLICNPFDDGNGNQLTNLFTTLPNQSSITTWGGATFNAAIPFQAGNWVGNTALPPGIGFFVKNGKAGSPTITNTFVGTVVCPDALVKIFIKADPEVRVQRRVKELRDSGAEAIYGSVLQDMKERDARDSGRRVAPLSAAPDAVTIDTTLLDPDQVFEQASDLIARSLARR